MFKKIFLKIYQFFLFFTLIAFVTTCSIYLFVQGVEITLETLKYNAKYTFFNVIFLAIIFYILDTARRKMTVERHIKKIVQNLEKITEGDFDIEIEKSNIIFSENQFDDIIDGINKMTKELGSVETFRSDFISNVSHEFKTPISIIQNYGTLLQDTSISYEEQIEYAKNITDTTKKLDKLITNILSLSKLENQQIFPSFKKFNLSDQICNSILNFEEEINIKEINIITNIEEDIYIKSDNELLNIVWNNLFSNAVKFTNPKGTITVTLKRKFDAIYVSIADNGIGMDVNTGNHIFDKFYQGDTAHSVKGNGLGLALVRRIINILNGEINVKSKIGEGSKFTVVLNNERV